MEKQQFRKETVLFVSPVLPDANGGGKEKRAHQWLTRLSAEYQVRVCAVIQDKPSAKTTNLPPHTQVFTYQHNKAEKWKQLVASGISMLAGKPKGAAFLGWIPLPEAHKPLLQAAYQQQKFDKIICFRLFTSDYAFYLQKITQTPVLELDLDDLESMTWGKIGQLLKQHKLYKKTLVHYLTQRHFYSQEQARIPRFNKVYMCSPEDQVLLSQRFNGVAIDVLPNRFYGAPVAPINLQAIQPKTVVFVGTLGYYPNQEAALWFAREVLPLLRKQDQSWEFRVIGSESPASLQQQLTQIAGVKFLGRVPSLETAYAQAQLIVAPLHAGGGTKLKVLEAMWYGRPVIATQEAVHGLNLVSGEHYLHAETPTEFVNACLQLSTDYQLYKRMVDKAAVVLADRFCY